MGEFFAEYCSPLLARPGAVAGSGVDAGVAVHYGDPLREQRLLADEGAVVDRSHRGVLTVSGPDRLDWLHRLTSQRIEGLGVGASSQALVLDAHGRIEYDLHVYEDGQQCWLLVDGRQCDRLSRWLESMRFLFQVQVDDVSAEWAVVSSTSRIRSVARAWQDPWPGVSPGGVAYSAEPHPGLGRSWFEHVVPRNGSVHRGELSLLEVAHERPLAGALAAEALRIQAFQPRWGVDTDEKSLPHELDLLRTAVHLNKGCYRGQETVARVHNVGRPPRRLTFLHLDGCNPKLPLAGSEVLMPPSEKPSVGAEGRSVGVLTSVAHHYEMGPIGLAVLKRGVSPQARLAVRGGDGSVHMAAQEVIVSPEAGRAAGPLPRLPRLRPPGVSSAQADDSRPKG